MLSYLLALQYSSRPRFDKKGSMTVSAKTSPLYAFLHVTRVRSLPACVLWGRFFSFPQCENYETTGKHAAYRTPPYDLSPHRGLPSHSFNASMGVTGLWTVVQPCARPIKIETLNKKRLAVDASIWIYQFLKAVRDKEGNALRNSHVVGFFRRICKLLFIGIKPVFVFDGGAPILKRQTVSSRKARREGRRDDAVRTAGKLLAVQMQRRAEEEEQKMREERERPVEEDEEEDVPDNPVYVDELQMSAQERQQNRKFRKKDAYHLPNLDVDLADMGAPNDPRIMSHEELEEYARQFHTGEDVNIYDFSKIDFESPFFLSLPASDRYNILNAARLRSRLRMGYSKEQLDIMFPNRMDFSRFQIERVKERNELTQRLMNINGMNGEDAMLGINNGGRVAGEKGKEYVLVKNDGVEGGWALGVVSNRGEGEKSRPIDVERSNEEEKAEDEDADWEDDGFEDVPIEGLNRLPKRQGAGGVDREQMPFESEEAAKRRRALYESRIEAVGGKQRNLEEADGQQEDPESLFIPQGEPSDKDEDVDELFEDVPAIEPEHEEEELQRAIAMSLEGDGDHDSTSETEMPSFSASAAAGPRVDRPLDFNQKNAAAGRDFAHLTNTRAQGQAPKPFVEDSDGEDEFNLRAGLEESRRSKHQPKTGPRAHGFKRPDKFEKRPNGPSKIATTSSDKSQGFDGPLPFESLSLGKSILGKKKKKPAEEAAGGFEKESNKEDTPQPLPPWFSGDIREEVAKQKAVEAQQHEGDRLDSRPQPAFDRSVLTRQKTDEVIDLDAPKERSDTVIPVESSSEDESDDLVFTDAKSVDTEVRMGDVADLARAEPPESNLPAENPSSPPKLAEPDVVDSEPSVKATDEPPARGSPVNELREKTAAEKSDDGDMIEWSDSDVEDGMRRVSQKAIIETPAGGPLRKEASSSPQKSPAPMLNDAGMAGSRKQSEPIADVNPAEPPKVPALPVEESTIVHTFDDLAEEEEQGYSDPEDEELMRQLAVEAEEHARFASTLNQKSQLQNAEDYEKELRQLRNQQKKDRRDADEVTHIMVTECQQLLKLFGLPYVTAPMEAEAQCASLVSMGLVDGIVTDDSDIFLFGGTRVYKNMFNQAKFVECYLASDLEKEYSLTREKLIRFAHLLGSDYTEGLPTVGPVTALEILSEFDTLEHFAEWWSAVQMASKPADADITTPFRKKFRKNATKIFLPANFPDTRVDHAYLNPEVDKDPQPFQWGVPDLDALRQYLMATIGWTQERTDEVLVPVIKDMNRRENEGTQANITRFFAGGVGVGGRDSGASQGAAPPAGQGFAPRRRAEGKSKRMESALGRLHERAKGRSVGEGETGPVEGDGGGTAAASADGGGVDEQPQKPKKGRKRAGKPVDVVPIREENEDDSLDDDDAEYTAPKRKRKEASGGAKRGRKRGKGNA